jgi:hypothetical protein
MNEDGTFVAIGAQEFGNLNDFGHMNIFDCLFRCPNPTENLLATYEFVKTQGAFATFNHPNPAYGSQFNSLAFYPDYVDELVGIEIRNGIRADDYEEQYVEALDKGWRVAPLANQDNHQGDWGDQTNPNMGGQIYLTGILADELTREAVYDAFRQRRFYAMEVDPPSDRIELFFYANGAIMGQQIVSGAHLTLTGTANTLNGVSLFNRVDLFQDGVVVATTQPLGTTVAWQFDRALADGESHYYFVRVRQVDGDYAWSAPIWVTTQIDPASVAEETVEAEPRIVGTAPNPFRRSATLSFRVPYQPGGEAATVALRVLDLSGREVGRMAERSFMGGLYEWTWDGRDAGTRRNLPAGVYFCQLLVAGGAADVRRIVLTR